MKLVTDKGELSLPTDFSFEVEQNSAFFSEDGAASIAATICHIIRSGQAGIPKQNGQEESIRELFPGQHPEGSIPEAGSAGSVLCQ